MPAGYLAYLIVSIIMALGAGFLLCNRLKKSETMVVPVISPDTLRVVESRLDTINASLNVMSEKWDKQSLTFEGVLSTFTEVQKEAAGVRAQLAQLRKDLVEPQQIKGQSLNTEDLQKTIQNVLKEQKKAEKKSKRKIKADMPTRWTKSGRPSKRKTTTTKRK